MTLKTHRINPTNWQTQVKIFEKAVIPKYKEIPVTVIKTNMRTAGMKREDYFQILEGV